MKFEYRAYNESASDEELLSDLKRVFDICKTGNLTMQQYSTYGKYDCSTITRRFETWNKALEKVEIPLTQKFWTEEELFDNIEKVWIQKGCQPRRRDMDNKNLSNISSGAYLRKYGKWSDALKAFVEYINADDISYISSSELQENKHRDNHVTKRDVNLRLRFKVFQRDNFRCRFCGASPATDSSIQLHVDHIIPWSKGGETVIENLQTLCSNCNLGKSNMN